MEVFDKELQLVETRENLRDSLFCRGEEDSSMVEGMLDQRNQFLELYKGPSNEGEARMLYEEAFIDFFGDCKVSGMVEFIWDNKCVRKCFLDFILGTYSGTLVPEGGDLNPWDSQNERILKLVKEYLG